MYVAALLMIKILINLIHHDSFTFHNILISWLMYDNYQFIRAGLFLFILCQFSTCLEAVNFNIVVVLLQSMYRTVVLIRHETTIILYYIV